jgi:hypothetical protein
MNTVGAAASIAGAYKYIRLYTCIYAVYIYIYIYIYIFSIHKRKSLPLSGPQNQHSYHITLSITPHKASCTYIFHNELFPTPSVQQRQHMDAVGCHTFITGLISMFMFDIVQFPSGRIAATYTPPPSQRPWVCIEMLWRRYVGQWYLGKQSLFIAIKKRST